tara:strand:+ start:485 stop:1240 length:756 start_codon:yes stop_codon:yes gene_type:complete
MYKFLPKKWFKALYGDRYKYGTKLDINDKDYQFWCEKYDTFYKKTQKKNLGVIVNHFGFKIVQTVNWENKVVVELGPGLIEHLTYIKKMPTKYILVDCDEQFLKKSEKICLDHGIQDVDLVLVNRNEITIPIESNSVDCAISFHQLEHIYDLDDYLIEIKRILKPGGLLVGAVPAEGGLAWGLGRFFTSRPYMINTLKVNFSKIISWEHPNFVTKVKDSLNKHFVSVKECKKPFSWLGFDFNLSYLFVFKK